MSKNKPKSDKKSKPSRRKQKERIRRVERLFKGSEGDDYYWTDEAHDPDAVTPLDPEDA